MPCNDKPNRKHPKELPTLWESFVLHKASQKAVMVFDLELDENENGNANKPNMSNEKQTMNFEQNMNTTESQDPNATTTGASMDESQQVSSPKPESKLPAALLASLECVRSLSRHSTATGSNSSTSSTRSKISNDHVYFGPKQECLLSPTVLHDDAERQEALIKPSSSPLLEAFTRKRQMQDDEAVKPEDTMMSGALEAGDARCEVCEKRERAIEGLEDVGVVAL